MMLQIDLWQGVGLVLSILSGIALLGKMALGQLSRADDIRHAALGAQINKIEMTTREESAHWDRVERELLELKVDLPSNYVRRDDYIRGQTVLEAKMDALFSELKLVQLKGERRD